MSSLIRILIADDHPIVRQGLRDLLVPRNGMEVVGEAENGLQAVEMSAELQPDLVIMDMVMPELDGAEATRRIRSQNPQARILILTSFGSEDALAETIQAGASGYLLKDSKPDDLLEAVRSVHRGHLTMPAHLAQKLVNRPVQPNASLESLTGREREVLAALAKGSTNKEIAARLDIGANTVRSHVSNILRKLNLSNRTQLAVYAKDHDVDLP